MGLGRAEGGRGMAMSHSPVESCTFGGQAGYLCPDNSSHEPAEPRPLGNYLDVPLISSP